MRFRDLPCNSEGVYRLEFNTRIHFPAEILAYYIVNMQILRGCIIRLQQSSYVVKIWAPKRRRWRKLLVVVVQLPLFHLRQKCLVRGVSLALCAFAASLLLAGFPYIQNLHGSRWQVLTMLAAGWGLGETARCIRKRWCFYHAGVVLLLYSELMILVLTVFLTFYP